MLDCVVYEVLYKLLSPSGAGQQSYGPELSLHLTAAWQCGSSNFTPVFASWQEVRGLFVTRPPKLKE